MPNRNQEPCKSMGGGRPKAAIASRHPAGGRISVSVGGPAPAEPRSTCEQSDESLASISSTPD